MPKLAAPFALLLALAALALAACGDSGDSTGSEAATFDEDEFGITFEYPGDWSLEEDITIADQLGASSANAVRGVMVDDEDGIIIESYTLNLSVDEDNIDQAKDELDGLISQLDSSASGTIGETAGLPSVTYEDVPLETPTDGESTLVAVFDGETEYLLNCQSTPDHRDEVQSGCDQALATVATK
jgi:hypothetical protein